MKQEFDFIGDCPTKVHNKITNTLNNLPRRNRQTSFFNVVNTLAASAAAILLLFIVTWTINPVMAQGNTFREMLAEFFVSYPEAEQIAEAPLPAPQINEAENETMPVETAALVTSDESEAKVPSVVIDGYEFRLEDQIIYDGAQLTVGYNVRKTDGSPMPSMEEFTKDHIAGFIRERELLMGDVKFLSQGELIFDWDDPYIYRQLITYDLRDVSSQVTDETEFVLCVGLYDYGEKPTDTIEKFANLPFCVNTEHEDYATGYELEQSTFDLGDFVVEVQPIVVSATGTKIEIRGYKEGDPDFGIEMGEKIFIRIQTIDGANMGITGSFGAGRAQDGSTYIETIYDLAPTEELPQQFRIYFTPGDGNTGETVDYDPIIVSFK